MRRLWWIALSVLAGMMLGGLVAVRARWTDDLAAQWRARLADGQPAETAATIARTLEGGELGIVLAVAALDAPEAHVAEAAREAISCRLDRCTADASGKAELWEQRLAAELARQCPGFRPAGRRRAASLALRMLTTLHRRPGEDRTQLTANCRRVLDMLDSLAADHSDRMSTAGEGNSSSGQAATSTSGPRASAVASYGDIPPLPGAAELLSPERQTLVPLESSVPLHRCPTDDSLPKASAAAEAGVNTGMDKPLRAVPEAAANKPSSASEGSAPGGDQRRRGGAALSPLTLESGESARLENAPSIKSTGNSEEKSIVDSDVWSLIGRLRTDRREAARTELQRRGFGVVELALAEKLVDPDPQVRLRLAQTLPQISTVEPHRWLLWLCRDDDAEVRLTAVSLLATCADPAVLAEVEQSAAVDPDPRVRRCAEQITARRTANPNAPKIR